MDDKVGKQTLETISAADKFNQWMFETIRPYAKGKVLEIGSGIGNISNHFLEKGFSLMLSDYNEAYCEELRKQFSDNPFVLGVKQIDLVDPDFDRKYKDLFQNFDTVFALNVIEHIEDDNLAIANCRKLLKTGGILIILVPSYQKLFNKFDVNLGHFRRYDISTMSFLIRENQLEIIHTQYFNLVGTLGWYVNGNILKKQQLPAGQMKIYNTLVPVFKMFDKVILNRAGLSAIVVGQKY